MARLTLAVLGVFALVFNPSCRGEHGTFDYLSLQRTMCYGGCPSYSVCVYANGRVLYNGGLFVRVTGRQTKQLTADQRDALSRELRRANYFRLRSSYQRKEDGCRSVWTDMPSVRTTVVMNGQAKSIEHYLGCSGGNDESREPEPYPPELTRLEDRIDEILRTEQWVRPPRARARAAAQLAPASW